MEYREIAIPVNKSEIKGNLTIVPGSTSLVIFAHGSGSSRFSERNKFVAEILQRAGISTFLFDLLTEQEEVIDQETKKFRFDIKLLADRLVLVTEWLQKNQDMRHIKLGYFGSSTGAAAALIAAAELPNIISAVVSRGGRPDMAEDFLPLVQSPTLLVVGEQDYDVIALNKLAYEKLHCTKELVIIPGATHLFQEPGTLEQASFFARDWFLKFFGILQKDLPIDIE